MQDRFKFKYFWDNKMYDVMSYDLEANTVTINTDETHFLTVGHKETDFTNLVQCTGLKDKNGKLIYEGDILRVNTGSRDTSGYGVVEYLQCGCEFVINGFLDNPSGYHPRKKGEFFQKLQEWLVTEVIGNVFENPELLKGEE